MNFCANIDYLSSSYFLNYLIISVKVIYINQFLTMNWVWCVWVLGFQALHIAAVGYYRPIHQGETVQECEELLSKPHEETMCDKHISLYFNHLLGPPTGFGWPSWAFKSNYSEVLLKHQWKMIMSFFKCLMLPAN